MFRIDFFNSLKRKHPYKTQIYKVTLLDLTKVEIIKLNAGRSGKIKLFNTLLETENISNHTSIKKFLYFLTKCF